VARVTVTDFRCYARQRLDCDPRPVVLSGPNGAGKTNLLEAISFLAPGRGLRHARLGDVARRDDGDISRRDGAGGPARAWGVAARISTALGDVDVGTGRDGSARPGGRERRQVRINGEAVKSQAALGQHFSAVWLTPGMDRLFVDGPSARRRFLDRLVFGADPAHAGRIAAFERALRERTRLLQGGFGAAPDANWLAVLEDTMAARGVAVAAARIEMTARLDAACAGRDGDFPAARLEVAGALEDWLRAGPALAAEDKCREHLEASRARDSKAGGAGTGPHRSDLVVRHRGRGVSAAECSTGEQKALLIAIVLAHAGLQAAERGAAPVLLLDEVAAHLDGARRQALFAEILALGSQAWMTGTDPELFAPLRGQAQFFGVDNARVTAQA